jgi:hypothetical protein
MKTLTDILRDADPLRAEPPRTRHAREQLRRAVLAAEPAAIPRRSRARRALAAVVIAIAGLLVATLTWQRASVNAVAAVRFEARVAETGQMIVANRDVLRTRVVPGSMPSTYGIELTFTPEGAEKMRMATETHVGEHLELLVDGEVVMAPLIRGVISTSATLSGDYSQAEAMRLVEGLLKGKLELRTEN